MKTQINKEDLIRLYVHEKLNQREIAELYNCDRKNIDYYLKKFSIPKRSKSESHYIMEAKNRGNEITIDEILKLLKGGMYLKDICHTLNISRTSLYKYTVQAGYNFRNHGLQRERQSKLMKHTKFTDKGYTARISKWAGFEDYRIKANRHAQKQFGYIVPKGYSIDHLYSVKDGYANNVPIDIISHMFNLRIIPISENIRKGTGSIITLNQLYDGVQCSTTIETASKDERK
jgi:hypothetical protein